jgi:hypothetical protein
MKCRHCDASLQHTFLDLGYAPPSNAYRSRADRAAPELTFPLRVMVCEHCWLVQTEDYSRADELFTEDYAYFSSASRSWLDHARRYTEAVTTRFGLGAGSHVVEIASNDGYLLRNFVAAGIPCLGVEPTASTAQAAEALGIPVRREFFGEAMAAGLVREGLAADLIIGNNVYAHVPDINDFTRGLRTALKPQGVVTLEFPHVMRLIESAQFDTVYHEHYSYHSLYTVSRIFAAAGLRVWDVEELPTHGGSLRVYGCHKADPRETTPAVAVLLGEEAARGLQSLDAYVGFQGRADRIKDDVLRFLLDVKQCGASVAGYGAAAKGNTLLNYAGVRGNLLPYVVDAAAAKQGKLLPGSHIPIHAPDVLVERQPDYVFILPWNLKDEVRAQLALLAAKGTKFVTAVPRLEIS